MENPNQIDELFKTTFESLPNNQPAGAWDTPSAQVWTNIEADVQAPAGGGGASNLMYWAGGLLVMGALGFMLLRKPQAAPVVTPVPAAVPVQTTPTESTPVAEPQKSQVPAKSAPAPAVEAQKTPKPKAKPAVAEQKSEQPASEPPARNNLERRRQGQ
jgi:hypothetical protein